MANGNNFLVHLALPKGRIQPGVFSLLKDANISVNVEVREYRPAVSLEGFEVKIQKPQNVIEMLHAGSRDLGFAGSDWVLELNADVVELLDTGLDPVSLVAASYDSEILNKSDRFPVFRIASEYENLTREWMKKKAPSARFIRSYGATEVFPPEDAELIIDITASGATLAANNLVVIDRILKSSTRLYANPKALDIPEKRQAIESLVLVLRSVLEARNRVMLEVNVAKKDIEAVSSILPCMREVTVAPLQGDDAVALKAAVPRSTLATLIPQIKARGGTDIIITQPIHIIP